MSKQWFVPAAVAAVLISMVPQTWAEGYVSGVVREDTRIIRGDDLGGPSYGGIERTNTSTYGNYGYSDDCTGKRSGSSYGASGSGSGSYGGSASRYDYEKEIWVNPYDSYLNESGYGSSARSQGRGTYDRDSDSYDKSTDRNFGRNDGYYNADLDYYIRSDVDYSNYGDGYHDAGYDASGW